MPTIAAIQTNASATVAENLARCTPYLAAARAHDAAVVVLPECFGFMPGNQQQLWAGAESPGDGEIQHFISATAKQHGMWIIAGSVALRTHDEPRVTNSSLVYDADGCCRARYDKIFLFDVALANGECYRESDYTAAGHLPVTVESPVGVIGLSICYDLRFPELYRRLTHLGAQILTIPAAFLATTGQHHWLPLLRARAIENTCYVVAPAQFGTHADGRKTWGHSLIIDPWGTVIAEKTNGWGLIHSPIDHHHLTQTRTQLPSLRHRRDDVLPA